MTVSGSSSACFRDRQGFPPGFRFHPTDEELVLYYLKRKICRRKLVLDVIGETDVYKWDPEDLPGQSKVRSGDRQWFFFSPRDRKYPNGARSNRATGFGYWKVTGKDRNITCNSRPVGVKKTLVFYRGRAPTGQRTDWVMHEYTLDEEELKRCQSAQDYYALYKLYKKSGAGPKNGEQYGAPFKEEEWADEDFLGFNNLVDQDSSVKQLNGVASFDNPGANGQQQALLNGLEGFVNCMTDEPVLVPPLSVNYDHVLQQLLGDEGDQGTMVDQLLREADLADQSIVMPPGSEQNNYDHVLWELLGEEEDQGTIVDQLLRDVGLPDQNILPPLTSEQNDLLAALDYFELTQSGTSQLQLHEAPEVTSAPNIDVQEPQLSEEDFLEMDDLLSAEPVVQNVDNTLENLQFDEIDGLSELDDLYQDATMFFGERGPVEPGQNTQPYMNNIEHGMVNLVSDSYLSNFENETLNYQLQTEALVANHIDYQLLTGTQDQRSSVITPAEANQMILSTPISGAVYEGNYVNQPSGANQNQISRQDHGTNLWTSALWSFVESIPTTPASAAENAMVNRTFQRMSSFSRVRLSAINTSVTTSNSTSTASRSGGFKFGFLFFSMLGVLCAILWVLKGTSMRIL